MSLETTDLAATIDRLGIRPWVSDLDKPCLNGVPERGELVFKNGKHLLEYFSNTADLNRYRYYVEMKELAHAVRVCDMPAAEDRIHNAKWTEWLACNDNYIHGKRLMDPRHFDMLLYFARNRENVLRRIMHVSTYCKISLDDYFYPLSHILDISNSVGDIGYRDKWRNRFGEAYPTIIHEMVLLSDVVAQDVKAPSTREKYKLRRPLKTPPYYKVITEGVDLLKHIRDIVLVHQCRPMAARAIYRDEDADSPMSQTVYGENTPLTRFLITRTASVTEQITALDPVWWWPNEEIRSKVNYKYGDKDASVTSWGWLLPAGVPPVVLCEHKLTKAEAQEFVMKRVPSWEYKMRRKGGLPLDEADRGMYFQDDKHDAISGKEIIRLRYAEQIKKLDSDALDWREGTVRRAIDRLIDQGDSIVAEWALNKIPWLTKEQIVHGPRGREYRFQPISRVDEIRASDIGGDVNASPEKVFERMGERIKKDIEQANLKGFAFPEWKHPLHPEVTYLGNSVALQTEGTMMHHCCASYSKKCEQGETFIFHVGAPAPFGSTVEAFYDEQLLSFGVGKGVKSKLVIYQHYGQRNSTPDPEDKKIVLEWVKMCKPKRVKKQTNPPLRWRDVVLCPPMRG